MDTGTRIDDPLVGDYLARDSSFDARAAYYNEGNYWNPKEGPGPRVMAASTLEDDNVVNGAGEKLGETSEIMIDVPSGRVAYAVLSVGGFLGMGDKLLAIPWRALKLDPQNKRFTLNVSKERLEQAPGFDRDHWPSMGDERWATELHNYYDAPFCWR